MLNISIEGSELILTYTPGRNNDASWVLEKLVDDEPYLLMGVFSITRSNLVGQSENEEGDDEASSISVKLGDLENEYWKISSNIIGISGSIRLHNTFTIIPEFFIHNSGISIFKEIYAITNSDIWIGGDKENAIPIEVFKHMVKRFPNYDEIKLYRRSRVSSVLSEYFSSAKDYEKKYEEYLIRKRRYKVKDRISHNAVKLTEDYKEFNEIELSKYQLLYSDLQEMLNNESGYDEKQWQNKILNILLLLYPKYLAVLSEVNILDVYTGSKRRLDFMLVDSTGCIDIVEIKKPTLGELISTGIYRGNYVPRHDLSGSVMQVEKYIFYLNKWGKTGEQELTKRYADKLPKDLSISITNPTGFIIAGRDLDSSDKRISDFEIIKRKYKNVLDIITYDDLLRRLQRTIEKFNVG